MVRALQVQEGTLESKLVLEVFLSKQIIKATTELTLVDLTYKLWDSREIKLNCRQRAEIDDAEASYDMKNYLEIVLPEDEIQSIDQFNDYWRASQFASDDGELCIFVPQEIADERKRGRRAENGSPNSNGAIESNRDELKLRIDYELIKPKGGIHFVLPDPKAYPTRSPHMYVTNEIQCGRMWFPCVDTLVDRNTFEVEITVERGYTAVFSGDLVSQTNNQDDTKTTFTYRLSSPSTASSLLLSVGDFFVYTDPKLPMVTHYCLPGREAELKETVSFLKQAFTFFDEYLAFQYPFTTYRQVFVEDTPKSVCSFMSASILSTHLLHPNTVIDQVFRTRRKLTYGLTAQFFGQFVSIRGWSDSWITVGISRYIAELFLRKMFGHNEYRYRMMKQPLNHNAFIHPVEIFENKIFARKSAIVVYMIERKVGLDAFRKVISSLVSPTADDPDSRVVDRNMITKKILKTIRRLTGHDLKGFADRWLHREGCSNIACAMEFNKRKHVLEFAMKQNRSPAGRVAISFTVRVNELDGPYDHVISTDDEYFFTELVCHSRVKKPRKKKKTKKEMMNNPEEKSDEEVGDGETPKIWVRVDPDLDTLNIVYIKQPEFYWINQLEQDLDVFAQYEAIEALKETVVNSFGSIDQLNKVLNDNQKFYRIRIDAARALAKNSVTGWDHLNKYFRDHFFDAKGLQVKPNDFRNLITAMIQRGCVEAIGSIRSNDNHTPDDIVEFILDVLKNNDNTINQYMDNYYLASLLTSVSLMRPMNRKFELKIYKQLERHLNVEKLLPSYHNTVTISCLNCERRAPKNPELFREYTTYGHYEGVRVTAISCLIVLMLNFFEHSDFHHENMRGNTDEPLSSSSSILEFLIQLFAVETSPYIRCKIIQRLSHPKRPHEVNYDRMSGQMDLYAQDHQFPKMKDFQRSLSHNNSIFNRLWYILNGPDTGCDARLRTLLRKFITNVWGGPKTNQRKDRPNHNQKGNRILTIKQPTVSSQSFQYPPAASLTANSGSSGRGHKRRVDEEADYVPGVEQKVRVTPDYNAPPKTLRIKPPKEGMSPPPLTADYGQSVPEEPVAAALSPTLPKKISIKPPTSGVTSPVIAAPAVVAKKRGTSKKAKAQSVPAHPEVSCTATIVDTHIRISMRDLIPIPDPIPNESPIDPLYIADPALLNPDSGSDIGPVRITLRIGDGTIGTRDV
ncbi:transcription initiation factor TFIID subunit 2 [Planoprotostelium fungivorum]|uniref:Transcription initiation factor TFIID subunit 2 n=1 Tax=Planoprotostelium fungivorum TaxID=1890364 RepID=A0A2P6N1C3_9EUKA|nr:transcription initiation factor TFIID subunit 2 [Planoprotostelium fungivorum]